MHLWSRWEEKNSAKQACVDCQNVKKIYLFHIAANANYLSAEHIAFRQNFECLTEIDKALGIWTTESL